MQCAPPPEVDTHPPPTPQIRSAAWPGWSYLDELVKKYPLGFLHLLSRPHILTADLRVSFPTHESTSLLVPPHLLRIVNNALRYAADVVQSVTIKHETGCPHYTPAPDKAPGTAPDTASDTASDTARPHFHFMVMGVLSTESDGEVPMADVVVRAARVTDSDSRQTGDRAFHLPHLCMSPPPYHTCVTSTCTPQHHVPHSGLSFCVWWGSA